MMKKNQRELPMPNLFIVAEVELIYRNKKSQQEKVKVDTAHACYDVLMSAWDMNKIELVEQFMILLLDGRNNVLGVSKISTGSISQCLVDPRIVFATALKARATTIILAHNHPTGDLSPSRHDIQLTKKLMEGAKLLDMHVVDHLIVSLIAIILLPMRDGFQPMNPCHCKVYNIYKSFRKERHGNRYIGYNEQDDIPPIPEIINKQIENVLTGQLLKGNIPWQNPLQAIEDHGNAMPSNIPYSSSYRGVNVLLIWASTKDNGYLSSDWGTQAEWQNLGVDVRYGEKATNVLYFDTVEETADERTYRINSVKTKQVFCRDQMEPISVTNEKHIVYDRTLPEKVGQIEEFLFNVGFKYDRVEHGLGYDPLLDKITLHEKNKFVDTPGCNAIEAYYMDVFYKLVLWTGAENRLERTTSNVHSIQKLKAEEFIAKIGAGFLCAEFNINLPNKSHDNDYISHCMDLLKTNSNSLVELANEASKASEYLFNLQPF